MNLPRILLLYVGIKRKRRKAVVRRQHSPLLCVCARDGHIMMGKGLFYTREIRKWHPEPLWLLLLLYQRDAMWCALKDPLPPTLRTSICPKKDLRADGECAYVHIYRGRGTDLATFYTHLRSRDNVERRLSRPSRLLSSCCNITPSLFI